MNLLQATANPFCIGLTGESKRKWSVKVGVDRSLLVTACLIKHDNLFKLVFA
jgi:hypothetical protein